MPLSRSREQEDVTPIRMSGVFCSYCHIEFGRKEERVKTESGDYHKDCYRKKIKKPGP